MPVPMPVPVRQSAYADRSHEGLGMAMTENLGGILWRYQMFMERELALVPCVFPGLAGSLGGPLAKYSHDVHF